MITKRLRGLLVGIRNIKCPFSCLTPAAFAIFIFFFFAWLLFELPYLLPKKQEPPPFLWPLQRSRNVSHYIKPDVNTLLLAPKVTCTPSTHLVFIVPSSINNAKNRDAIRETWGLWVRNRISSAKEDVAPEMKLFFILGKDEMWPEGQIDGQILEESELYDDIILEDFIDSYLNLTLKSVFMLKWVDVNCPQAKYIMKTDDDMFINVPNLRRALSKIQDNIPLLMGMLICNAQPIQNRWSKWYSPTYMFSGKYPNYLSGTAYVISGGLVKQLLNTAIQTPFFHLEDIFITGICSKKLGVRPTNNIEFTYQKRAYNPCIYKDIITGHEVTPAQMKGLWKMIQNQLLLARCKPVSKKVLYPNQLGKCVWK